MALNALAAVPVEASGGTAASKPSPEQAQAMQLKGWMDSQNIAEDLDDAALLATIGSRVVEEYKIDVQSRSEWMTKTEEAMNLAMQVAKEKQFPWPKAANIIYPLVTTASTQFAARAYPAIINGRSIVKGVVIGDDDGQPATDPRSGQPVVQQGPNGQPMPVWAVPPGAKRTRADQIGEHMSWQLLDEMPEWEPDTDLLLHVLPIVGCCFRKTYYDPAKQRNCSLYVSAVKVVINYHAKSVETAPRITEEMEFYPREIEENFRSGLWLRPEHPFGDAEGSEGDHDKAHEFLEQHRFWDLDDDGYPEPYIVTVHKTSQQVVRIVARFDQDGIKLNQIKGTIQRIDPIHYYTRYEFLPNPDGGIYGLGFGQLLRPINEGINTVLNQMLDAATLQNAGGGFIGKGLSMNSGAIRFQLGEYKSVNVAGGTLRENIVPLPFPGPSPVLFNLLGFLVESGKEIAAIKDVLTGEQKAANVPATTTLALIEQGLKTFTAIYKRVHRALKSELDKLYRLNGIYGDEQAQYKVGDTWKTVARQDYVMGSGVEPYSDPSMVSDMQRMARAQFLLGFRMDPNVNGVKVLRRAFSAADIDNIDELIVEQTPPNPAIAAKGMELEIKGQEAAANAGLKKAQEVAAYAGAINALAQADKAVGDQHLAWLDQQLRAWETEFAAAAAPTQNADGSPGGTAGTPPPRPMLPHPIPGKGDGNIQPHISDPDNMAGSPMAGVVDGSRGPHIDPDSHYAMDHS